MPFDPKNGVPWRGQIVYVSFEKWGWRDSWRDNWGYIGVYIHTPILPKFAAKTAILSV